jgi:methyltransferase (TIGR00027 family)
VAAGLDTRAYRLSWPAQVRVFELDQPEVLARKQEFLDSAGTQPGCARLPTGVDLAGRWTLPLLEAGFDPQACRAGWRRGSCSICPQTGSPASWSR